MRQEHRYFQDRKLLIVCFIMLVAVMGAGCVSSPGEPDPPPLEADLCGEYSSPSVSWLAPNGDLQHATPQETCYLKVYTNRTYEMQLDVNVSGRSFSLHQEGEYVVTDTDYVPEGVWENYIWKGRIHFIPQEGALWESGFSLSIGLSLADHPELPLGPGDGSLRIDGWFRKR